MQSGPDASLLLRDRADAGRRLAERLFRLKPENPVVLAVQRGGAPVAVEVAHRLNAPLDAVVVQEVTLRGSMGQALGAVAEGNLSLLDTSLTETSDHLGVDLRAEAERTHREVERTVERYRAGRPPQNIAGRTVLLVSDGIANAAVMRVAIQCARSRGARRVVAAIGVCSRSNTFAIRRECDEVVVLRQPEYFLTAREWYRDFPEVTVEEVAAILRSARSETHAAEVVAKAPRGRVDSFA